MKRLIIAIDGPSGVGKSSTSRLLAKRLGYRYVDSGAMYRAAALQAERKGILLEDEKGLEKVCKEMNLIFKDTEDGIRIILDGDDISELIRRPGIGEKASIISQYKNIREILTDKQRKLGENRSIIMEGRDIGSVVFPDADLKIFLNATEDERAKRRSKEWAERGVHVTKEEILKEIRQRDLRDKTREVAPLKVPKGAIVIDTTDRSLNEVVDLILSLIKERLSNNDTKEERIQ